NRILSKIRSRVEYVYADIKSFGAGRKRTIGIERAKVLIAFANIVYNMHRYYFFFGQNEDDRLKSVQSPFLMTFRNER
ncbi:MAG TPA: transposase, partial [Leptospiraceae bacterium]|nr:transposase [Leptospiraceae bacterium]